MADDIHVVDSPASITRLVGGIVTDFETLVRQELQLAKSEMRQEWTKTKTAAQEMAAGTAMLSVGVLFLCVALAELIHWVAPNLPEWGAFGIVGVALALVGGILIGAGRSKASDISLIPPQTAETMRENVQWLKNQT